MNEQLLGTTTKYFLVGQKDGDTFAIRTSGFQTYRIGDIEGATWFDKSDTVIQMAQLLTAFANLNGDTTTFSGRKRLIEYAEITEETTEQGAV